MRCTIHSDFALRNCLAGLALLGVLSGWARAAELRVPATVEAGQGFSIPAEGSGQATFYLVGP